MTEVSAAAELESADAAFRNGLTAAGLLVPSGVRGVFGLAGAFETIVEHFEALLTRIGSEQRPEVVRFPPILSRATYLRTDHLETFPNLMGSVHSFVGSDRELPRLIEQRASGADWTRELAQTEVMMVPAACYPLYPSATGTLPPGGRTVDLRSFVFRHEPSDDPGRMQIFRQREFVRLGTPDEALNHRNDWLRRGEEILRSMGLDVEAVVANDPFFGRGGRVMAATQREQTLKYELVATVASSASPTAIASTNYHVDHFGAAFDIRTADGEVAHTACIGFGLERIALALFRKHGFDAARWPDAVRERLAL
jgi:seryl-tRNA synthetase